MVWRIGLRHGDEILGGRITNTRKVDTGTCFRTDVKVGYEGKLRRRIWISTRSNQGISHFINVVFKRRRTTAKQLWCAFYNGPQPSIRCAVVTDPETWKNIVRQKGRCFGCLKTSHNIFFMWKCNDEQRLTMSMRTQNSRLRRMEKKLSVWESGCTADWPIPFSQARICSHI